MNQKETKVISCRVLNGLSEAINDRAEDTGRNINDLVGEILNKEFHIDPETRTASIDPVIISRKIMELKKQIKELKDSDEGGWLFRDSDIGACVEALEIECKQLVDSLPEREKGSLLSSFL